MGLRMMLRGVTLLAGMSIAGSAYAGELLKPEQAKQFVADKLFAYTCFDGTTGAGRIHADGSVVGSIRMQGQGPSRWVTLPPNTIRVSTEAICASVRGIPITPCFNVQKIDSNRFRGSISGLGFAYCDFTRRGPRLQTAEYSDGRPTSLTPLHLRAKVAVRPRSTPIKSADVGETGSVSARKDAGEPELRLRPSTND